MKCRTSLAQHDLHAQPDRTDETRGDNGHNRLEGIALRLLDALAPSSQVLEVGTQLSAILLFDTE